jgi:hypothetical protein
MARTKRKVLEDRRTNEKRMAAAAQRRASIERAARIASSQELAERYGPKRSPLAAPAASGYAYGSRRRPATAALSEQEEAEDGWADEARAIFREHEGRRSLVDGNARTCGQDALVAVATGLGVQTSKDAVRAATLPVEGDTPVGTIRAFAAGSLGIVMRSLKDHTIIGFSPWEQPGGAEHQLLLIEHGLFWVELIITMPKQSSAAAAKVPGRGSNEWQPRRVAAG